MNKEDAFYIVGCAFIAPHLPTTVGLSVAIVFFLIGHIIVWMKERDGI
jgi:hypothetical protein